MYGSTTESLIHKSMNNEVQDKLEQVKNDAHKLGQHVSEVISAGGGKMLKEKLETAVDAVQTHGKKVDTMARENTWITAGIAAVVGMIVGLFFSSRRRS